MAQGTTTLGGQFMLKLGDGGNPENFTLIGGFTSKTFAFAATTAAFQIPDDNAPDAAIWDETIVKSLNASLDCDGFMEAETVALWDAFMIGGVAKNTQMRFAAPPAIAGRTYEVAMVCTKVSYGAKIQDKITASISLKSSGVPTIAQT